MKISYEGIGQWAATFACSGVTEGQIVKVSGNGTAAGCESGDAFCGAAVSVARTGDACSVALGGLVTATFTGTAPAPGYTALSADGTGGVKCSESGRSYLVVSADTDTVTFLL